VSTDLYEASRRQVGDFVGARSTDAVVLTKNTTDALGLLAHCLPAGSTVVHLDVEHHANLLPWRRHEVLPVVAASTLAETLSALDRALASRPTALLAVTGASNVTGEVLPVAELAALAHRHGARLVVDAAQLAPHRRIDLEAWDVDYVALSGHKLYAPFGAGALVGRADWLESAPAYLPGGGTVREVGLDSVTWGPVPARHEGGTPNLLGAAALAASCRALAELPESAVLEHERLLVERLEAGLSLVPGVRVLRVWDDALDRVAVVSFVIDGVDHGLLTAALAAEHGIGVRDGRFCAHPLLARLTDGTTAVRASFGVGSSSADVDRLVEAITRIVADGPLWDYARTEAGWTPSPDPRDLDPFAVRSTVRAEAPVCEPPAEAAS
jgi:selenocysteine lyase/cysteine desulfurase